MAAAKLSSLIRFVTVPLELIQGELETVSRKNETISGRSMRKSGRLHSDKELICAASFAIGSVGSNRGLQTKAAQSFESENSKVKRPWADSMLDAAAPKGPMAKR